MLKSNTQSNIEGDRPTVIATAIVNGTSDNSDSFTSELDFFPFHYLL